MALSSSRVAHSLGAGHRRRSACTELRGQRSPSFSVLLPGLHINLAQHVILRKLVGGETEIGSFIEVTVTRRLFIGFLESKDIAAGVS